MLLSFSIRHHPFTVGRCQADDPWLKGKQNSSRYEKVIYLGEEIPLYNT